MVDRAGMVISVRKNTAGCNKLYPGTALMAERKLRVCKSRHMRKEDKDML
jgi:hypothetical protein